MKNNGHPKDVVMDEEGFKRLAKLAGIPEEVVKKLLEQAEDDDE